MEVHLIVRVHYSNESCLLSQEGGHVSRGYHALKGRKGEGWEGRGRGVSVVVGDGREWG